MKLFSTLLVAALFAFAASKVSYDGHQVWRIGAKNELEGSALRTIVEHLNLDVFSHGADYIDVRVPPRDTGRLNVMISRSGLFHRKILSDLGELIKAEEIEIAKQPKAFALDQYNTFEDIETYLSDVAASSSYATLGSLGKSVEGRDLWQLKISVGTGKPSVWIDCNIHAREWITAATCLYGIDLFINGYGSNADVTAALDAYDFYILTVNNPDGYAFTWSDDRMWRKNRNKYDGDACYGTDINRNFDDHFGGDGTSANSCSETYHGPSPASEPETQATQNGIKDLLANANLKQLYSIHSYSQLWMYPYGWTSTLPPDAAELDRVSKIGVDALTAVHGTQYVYGPVATTIYPAASTTIDYSYAVGVNQSYTLELRDTGNFGFQLPADQIIPVGEETWAGLLAAILAV